jgi:DnaJ homolog subfamily C member 28
VATEWAPVLPQSVYDRGMPPIRKDAVGRVQTAHSWESLVERQIREAMEGGAFEDLPYQGERLPIEDDSAAGEFAMANRMLKNAGAAPPWIESDKEARRLLAEIEASLARAPHVSAVSRDRVRRDHSALVIAANRAIQRLNAEAPTNRQHRRLLDIDAESGRLERAFGDRPDIATGD